MVQLFVTTQSPDGVHVAVVVPVAWGPGHPAKHLLPTAFLPEVHAAKPAVVMLLVQTAQEKAGNTDGLSRMAWCLQASNQIGLHTFVLCLSWQQCVHR